MRPTAVMTAMMTAGLAAGALAPAFAGEPAEVRWENRMAEQAVYDEAADVAVSTDGATAYAVGAYLANSGDVDHPPFVHAIDVASGATRWSATLRPGLTLRRTT